MPCGRQRLPIRVAERPSSKSSFHCVTVDTSPSAYVLYLCLAMARKLALSILIFGLGLLILPVVCATQKPYVQGKFRRHSAEK